MRRLAVDPFEPEAGAIADAADVIRRGGLVAFPTETVYGLGAHALDAAAVQKIYAAKGRPSFNPLIVHVGTVTEAQRLVTHWPESARRLADAFWPGPITLVLPRVPGVPDAVTARLDTVGVRIPAHPVALALLRQAGVPVAAPSANRSTEVSPTTADHVIQSLGDRVDVVLDAGPTSVGIESTVIDLTGAHPRLLRPGMIGPREISRVAGLEVGSPAVRLEGGTARPSPGLLERHYAPRAALHVLPARELHRAPVPGRLVGIVSHTGVTVPGARVIDLPGEPAGYARGLYAALHQLDSLHCEEIRVEQPPEGPEWNAIHDRLRRAAHE